MNRKVIKDNKEAFDYWLNGGSVWVKYITTIDDEPETEWIRRHPENDVGIEWNEYSQSFWKEIAYVLDDQFAELRRAQADGEVIESVVTHKGSSSRGGFENPWKVDTSGKFTFEPSYYRIKQKPKPKFKVGDTVLITSNYDTWSDTIVSIDDNRYHFELGGHLTFDRQDEQLKLERFKEGDWVLTEGTDEDYNSVEFVGQVQKDQKIKIFEPFCSYTSSVENTTKKWEPQAGDYCFFYTLEMKDTFAVLGRFEKLFSSGKYSIAGTTLMYTKCEPFFGELPSNLKVK